MKPNRTTRRCVATMTLGSLLFVVGCASTPRSTYRRAQRAGLEEKVAAALHLDEEARRKLESLKPKTKHGRSEELGRGGMLQMSFWPLGFNDFDFAHQVRDARKTAESRKAILPRFLATKPASDSRGYYVDYETIGHRLGVRPEKANERFIEELLTGWTVKNTVDEPVVLGSRAIINFTDLLGTKRSLLLRKVPNPNYDRWKIDGFDPETMDVMAQLAWEKGLYDAEQSLKGDRSKVNALVGAFLRGQMTDRDYVAESVLLSLELYPFDANRETAHALLRAAGQKLAGASFRQKPGTPNADEYSMHISPDGHAVVQFGFELPVDPSGGFRDRVTRLASTYLTPDQSIVTVPQRVPKKYQEWVARDTQKAKGFGTNEFPWGDIDASRLSLIFLRQEESWKLVGISSGIWAFVEAPVESNRNIIETTAEFADALASPKGVDWGQLESNGVFTLAGQTLSWGVGPDDDRADEITKRITVAFEDREFAQAVSNFQAVIVTRHGRTAFVAMGAPNTDLMLYYRLLKGPRRWTIVSITDSPEGELNDK
jgi:hypothetical protein